jgi:CPA2 family monovalent cation:H+ antiporter-2
VEHGVIGPRLFDLILAAALLSILLTPALLRAAPWLQRQAERLPLLGLRFAEPVGADEATEGLRRHTVICGFGRVARELAEALERRGFRYLVIEYNPQIVRDLRARQVPVIYGDAANPAVLEHAHLERAQLLAVLLPDAQTTEVVTRQARTAHRRLDIVARAESAAQVERLRLAGATEAVQPEFEAGLEVIRHALYRYGVTSFELLNLVSGRRADFYRRVAEADSG